MPLALRAPRAPPPQPPGALQRLSRPRQRGAAVIAQRLAARAHPLQLRTPRRRPEPAGKRTQREHRACACPTGNFFVRLHLRVLLSLCNGARSLDDSCQETYRDPFHRPPLWRTKHPTLSFSKVIRTKKGSFCARKRSRLRISIDSRAHTLGSEERGASYGCHCTTISAAFPVARTTRSMHRSNESLVQEERTGHNARRA